MRDLTKKLLNLMKPFKKVVFYMMLFLVVHQLINLVSPYIYGKIIDSIIAKHSFARTLMLIAIAGLAYITSNLIGYFENVFEIKKFDYDFSVHIAQKTLERFFSFSIGQHVNQHSGIKQSVIKRGESAINNFANLILYDALPVITETLAITIALLFMIPIIGIIVLVFDLIFIFVTIYINKVIAPTLAIYKDKDVEEGKFYSELMRNAELVQVNAQEERLSRDYDAILDDLFGLAKKLWIKFMAMGSSRSIFVSLVKVLVMVLGVYLVYQGKYTPGYLVVIFSWTSNVFNNLWRVGNIHRKATDMVESIKKYFELMEIEPDIIEAAKPIKPAKFEGKIEFKNVSFKYPATKYLEADGTDKSAEEQVTRPTPDALNDVSFVIEPGQKVAFVGHSGAGKTTITHLLLRAYDPNGGQVIVDGNDLKELDLRNYRKNLGMVEQSVSLFDNTLRYNILLGLGDDGEKITAEQLDKIAKLSCIDKFYSRLEKGFETILGERGVKLSGGERQRVGIARALIKEPKILIFDEATSSLDTENEMLIHQAIEHASEGRTTIIIAHRLSTIKDADKIFVLDKGKLVGEGNHTELMKTCEQYKNLINKQMVGVR